MGDKLHFRCPSCGRINRVDADRSGPTCGGCKASLDVSGAPVHLSDDQLSQLLSKSPVPVLIDFYADWCGPCRMLAPHLEQLGKKHAGKLVVAKVDTERHQREAARLGVQGIPALFLYKGGRLVDQAAGFRPLPGLEQLVAPHL